MYPRSHDYWDGNWMVSPITVRIGGFAGSIDAGLRQPELTGLRHGLQHLQATREGHAELESLEPWLRLRVEFDPDLGLTARGEAVADPSSGTKLVYRLEGLNEPDLGIWIERLQAVEDEFPIRDGWSPK